MDHATYHITELELDVSKLEDKFAIHSESQCVTIKTFDKIIVDLRKQLIDEDLDRRCLAEAALVTSNKLRHDDHY
jgi:hypothetical protein